MPCYENCWEAVDAASCLHHLQSLPTQVSVSTAFRKLRDCRKNEEIMLEVSDFGMFTLMFGKLRQPLSLRADYMTELLMPMSALHGSLFLAMQEEPHPHISPPESCHGLEPPILKREQLTGENVTNLADRTIELRGSAAMQRCNESMKAWKRLWEYLHLRNQNVESRTFSNDPLPFWYLGKLYQVLYLYGGLVDNKAELRMPVGEGDHDKWKIGIQDKIFSWLADFRKQTSPSAQDSAMIPCHGPAHLASAS